MLINDIPLVVNGRMLNIYLQLSNVVNWLDVNVNQEKMGGMHYSKLGRRNDMSEVSLVQIIRKID